MISRRIYFWFGAQQAASSLFRLIYLWRALVAEWFTFSLRVCEEVCIHTPPLATFTYPIECGATTKTLSDSGLVPLSADRYAGTLALLEHTANT